MRSVVQSSHWIYYCLTIFERSKDSSLKEEFYFLLSSTIIRAKFLGNDFSQFTVNFISAPSYGHTIKKGCPFSAYYSEMFSVIILEIQIQQQVWPHMVSIRGRLLSRYYWLQIRQKNYAYIFQFLCDRLLFYIIFNGFNCQNLGLKSRQFIKTTLR